MLVLLWLIPALPLLSAAVLAVFGSRWPKAVTSVLGCASVGIAAVLAIVIAVDFITAAPAGHAYVQTLWTWVDAGGLRVGVGLYLDALSLLMALVVTWVGFFIHLYSVEYMEESEGYSRFFAYMNLFVASMLLLVLGDNLLLLFLGWEGVGLCSYLLIGFWYTDSVNGAAAQKAFIVTRVGDTSFTIGLLLLFTSLGTLGIQEVLRRAGSTWPAGSTLPVAAAALLLGGAVGKSAQLPLQTWLPDAMAGPTPTSALIHAATMVTAGVYLIARMNALFLLAPPVMTAVAVIGAATLLMAGCSALTQREIKRVLAYSTVSQIGYMFLGLGVAAWAPAMFHFMTHAFFKALLFLAAGAVIEALHHENDIFRMGGLWRRLPLVFWAFLIGGSALAGLPFVTAGFYSKDLIIWQSLSSDHGSWGLWVAALVGVLLTSLYTYRLIFVVFFGSEQGHLVKRPRWTMAVPLVVLSALSIVGGFVNLPPTLAESGRWFEGFLTTAVPGTHAAHGPISEGLSELAAALMMLAGLGLAWWLYVLQPAVPRVISQGALGRSVHRLWFTDWGMDWLYDRALVRPIVWAARANRDDAIDALYDGVALLAAAIWRGLRLTETGRLRWYATGILAGTVLFVGLVLL